MNPNLFDLLSASGHARHPLRRSAPIPPFTDFPNVAAAICIRSAGDGADRADTDVAKAPAQPDTFRTLIFVDSDAHSVVERAPIFRRSPTLTLRISLPRDSHMIPNAPKRLCPEMKKPPKTLMLSMAFSDCGGSQPPRPTFDRSSGVIRRNLLNFEAILREVVVSLLQDIPITLGASTLIQR